MMQLCYVFIQSHSACYRERNNQKRDFKSLTPWLQPCGILGAQQKCKQNGKIMPCFNKCVHKVYNCSRLYLTACLDKDVTDGFNTKVKF